MSGISRAIWRAIACRDRSSNVDVDDFDRVVAVAEPVPDGDFGFDVPGGIGGTARGSCAPAPSAPTRTTSSATGRAFGRFQVRWQPC